MRFALVFSLLAVALATLAMRLWGRATGLWWLLLGAEVWMAISLLAVALIYGLGERGVSVEDLRVSGLWSRIGRVLLLPFFALGASILYTSRWFDREGLFNLVLPEIYVGRLPFPSELARLRAAGISAVLNLCWEFPRLSGVDRDARFVTARVPILDGSPPSDQQFSAAVQQVVQWRAQGHRVLIHCAQGHGRTPTIAAAILVQLDLARDIETGLAMIRAARPRARPSYRQAQALIRYISRNLEAK